MHVNWMFKVYICFIDILKHSDKNNPDHQALVAALASIREVMTHINEDKRRTEGQVALFDIFNDIDNCPVSILNHYMYYFVTIFKLFFKASDLLVF